MYDNEGSDTRHNKATMNDYSREPEAKALKHAIITLVDKPFPETDYRADKEYIKIIDKLEKQLEDIEYDRSTRTPGEPTTGI